MGEDGDLGPLAASSPFIIYKARYLESRRLIVRAGDSSFADSGSPRNRGMTGERFILFDILNKT